MATARLSASVRMAIDAATVTAYSSVESSQASVGHSPRSSGVQFTGRVAGVCTAVVAAPDGRGELGVA